MSSQTTCVREAFLQQEQVFLLLHCPLMRHFFLWFLLAFVVVWFFGKSKCTWATCLNVWVRGVSGSGGDSFMPFHYAHVFSFLITLLLLRDTFQVALVIASLLMTSERTLRTCVPHAIPTGTRLLFTAFPHNETFFGFELPCNCLIH